MSANTIHYDDWYALQGFLKDYLLGNTKSWIKTDRGGERFVLEGDISLDLLADQILRSGIVKGLNHPE